MKNALSIAVICTFMFAALANSKVPSIEKGFKIGLNSSHISGKNSYKSGSKNGYGFGAFVRFGFSPVVSIQPELLYSMKGAEDNIYLDDTPAKFTLKLSYLEAPIMAKINIPSKGIVRPYLCGGPVFAFKLDERINLGAQSNSEERKTSDVKNFDMGFALGGGIDFKLFNGYLGIEGRTTLGQSAIYKSKLSNRATNSVISILANYSF